MNKNHSTIECHFNLVFALNLQLIQLMLVIIVGCSIVTGCQPPSPHVLPNDNTQPMSGKSLDNWKNVFDEMTTVLNLNEVDQKQLRAAFEQRVLTLQTWYAENGEKVAQADAEAFRAMESKDLSRLRQLKKEITPLKNEVMKLHEAMDNAVLNALDESKRYQWQGYRLASRLMQLCEPIEVTNDQRQQIMQMGVRVAESVKEKPVPQSAGFMELEKLVESKVFTLEQRESYSKIKNENKLRSLKTLSSFQNTDGSFR